MIKKSTLTQLALIIISIALSLPTFAMAASPSITHQSPTKDDILYLKQDAPVFETTIPEIRAKFNQNNATLFLNEYKIITNNDITIPLVRAATRITPYLYSSAVLERGSEKIKSLQLTLIHTLDTPQIEKEHQDTAMRYITALVTQFDPSINATQIQEVLNLFAVKQDVPAYISHNVGAIRYIIAHEDFNN